MTGPLARRWALLRVARYARHVGRQERRGRMPGLTLCLLFGARHAAAGAGCDRVDVDDATLAGLDAGGALTSA